MAETCVDYSNLKNKILEMWVPGAGIKTITDLVRDNWKKIFSYIFDIDDIPRLVKEEMEK